MGTGHLMRCLALADDLREKGAEIAFICRLLPGDLCSYVEKKGYPVHRLPYATQLINYETPHDRHAQRLGTGWQADAGETKAILEDNCGINWLVVDHYALDARWETRMRPYVKKIMVIDDLADRPHNCDLLLDQNLYANMETRYRELVPDHCQKLLGPKYALLRPEFRETRKNLRKRDGNVHRILIFFGGGDPTNETTKALQAVQLLNRPDIAVDVVVGAANPHQEQIKQYCSALPNTSFFCQVNNMAQLMANADLAIGAGGTATWERCLLGLPSITLVIAQNQADTTAAAAAKGAAWNLGWSGGVSPERLADCIKKALNCPTALKSVGQNAMRLMGDGPLNKNPVLEALMEDCNVMS